MKTILIATDFSQASRNAAVYGLELARALNTKVILFSSYLPMPLPVMASSVIDLAEDLKKSTQQQLQQEEKSINTGSRVTVETICREGVAADAILEAAREKKAGLIIAGMKEGGKGTRRVLGSTATTLAKKADIPLIIVPEKTKYIRISSIALANESDLETDADDHLLDSLREIAAQFHSKIYVVRVAKNRIKATYETLNRPFKLIRILRMLDPSYGTVEGKSVAEGLNHFIEGYHIHLLAMLPHKHSLLERWFIKSATRSVIFETHIPLLILPDLHIG